MTKFITVLLLLFGCQFAIDAQDIECGNSGIITFTDIECDGTYVTFMATSTTINSTSAYFTGVPPGSTVIYDGREPSELFNGESGLFSVSHPSEPTIFNMPVTSCDPLPLNFTFEKGFHTNQMECTFQVLLEADNRPIPTLGEWGLITLAILTLIFGILKINSILSIHPTINELK